MNSGHVATDEPWPGHFDQTLDARRSPSLSDEIGERVVILDESDAPALELLRFRRALTAIPGFEVALRRRVERLRHFQHELFAKTPTVEYLDHDRCLALVSAHTPGRRLSSVLGHAQDPALAASLVHQLVPALAALNAYGDGIGHGALTASRIIISPDGTPIVVEHVLGPALERLHLSASDMCAVLNIPVPSAHAAQSGNGGAIDCFQLALIALSMLLGRPLTVDECSEPLAKALDAALPGADAESGAAPRGLRTWLDRALRQDLSGFLSVAEAKDALSSISAPDPAVAQRWRTLLDAPHDEAAREVAVAPQPESAEEIAPVPIAVVEEEVHAPPAPAPAQPERPSAVSELVRARRENSFRPQNSVLRWSGIAVAVCAVVEAAVIVYLLGGRSSAPPPPSSVAEISLVTAEPGSRVEVNGQSAGVTPLRLTINSDVRSISVASPPLPPALKAILEKEGIAGKDTVVGSTGLRDATTAAARGKSVPPAPEPPRTGRIKVSSPIALEIFEGDRRLDSAEPGIVSAVAGRRELEFVNSTLGFRSRQVVDVKAGQTVAISVTPPDGRININAVPWAEVLIDGKLVGETPIGNLSIPLGEHEIVFRHPKLGEVRRTAVVRSDAVTRVSANLER
jgi:hypothetical protein